MSSNSFIQKTKSKVEGIISFLQALSWFAANFVLVCLNGLICCVLLPLVLSGHPQGLALVGAVILWLLLWKYLSYYDSKKDEFED